MRRVARGFIVSRLRNMRVRCQFTSLRKARNRGAETVLFVELTLIVAMARRFCWLSLLLAQLSPPTFELSMFHDDGSGFLEKWIKFPNLFTNKRAYLVIDLYLG